MAFTRVAAFSLGYDTSNKKFLINYFLDGSPDAFQFFPSPDEFIGLADMFRNEGTTVGVSYDDSAGYFVSNQTALA